MVAVMKPADLLDALEQLQTILSTSIQLFSFLFSLILKESRLKIQVEVS